MHWLSLIPCCDESAPGSAAYAIDEAAVRRRLLAWWALQFTPRVACLEEAVVLEVSGSLRLFGGMSALFARLQAAAPVMGFSALAQAHTSLAALACSRQGGSDTVVCSKGDLPMLDGLPLEALSGVACHRETLARLGCRTLGDVRRLPRAGLSRRFGAGLLQTLDRAYGLREHPHDWIVLPEVFDERLELPERVESAPALVQAASCLLGRLQAWLVARRAGVRAVVLRWQHDMAARAAGAGGSLEVRTAEPARDVRHLGRLLDEHLARTELAAPVGEVALRASAIELLPECPGTFWPDPADRAAAGAGLRQALERLSVRLGPQRVLRPVLQPSHRPEAMQCWVPAAQDVKRELAGLMGGEVGSEVPWPSWLLDAPEALPVRQHSPHYQGRLRLLAGPHRVRSRWWVAPTDGRAGGAAGATAGAEVEGTRDYFVAESPGAGLVWVFRQARVGADESGWYLHGFYG